MFIEAVLSQARTGLPWRDLPDDFGNWEAVYHRFRRWEARDIWKNLWQHVQQNGCELATQVCIDTTIMRAYQHAAGAQKNGDQDAQVLGRSRGGFATKFHAACTNENTRGLPLLSSGARHDAPGCELVWHDLPALPALDTAVMDKAYDSEAIRQVLHAQGMDAVIPGKTNRLEELPYEKAQYTLRQTMERFLNKLKQFRRIVTRYDKLSRTFLAFIHLVATWIMIR